MLFLKIMQLMKIQIVNFVGILDKKKYQNLQFCKNFEKYYNCIFFRFGQLWLHKVLHESSCKILRNLKTVASFNFLSKQISTKIPLEDSFRFIFKWKGSSLIDYYNVFNLSGCRSRKGILRNEESGLEMDSCLPVQAVFVQAIFPVSAI